VNPFPLKAAQMKRIVLSGNKKKDYLKGKSIVTVFSEASTRTRSSFELAGKYLQVTSDWDAHAPHHLH